MMMLGGRSMREKVGMRMCGVASATTLSALVFACGDNLSIKEPPPADAVGDSPDGPAIDPRCTVGWRDQRLGTDRDDQIWGMGISRGNIYVSGFEGGVTRATNIEPSGDARGVVIQLDPTGVPRWKSVIDTPATDTIEHVAFDPASSHIYAVGRTSGAFPGFVNQGQFDGLVVELDDAGEVTDLLQWGDERPQHPVRISAGVNSGDIVVAGFDDIFIRTNYVVSWEDGLIASFARTFPEVRLTPNFFRKVSLRRANMISDAIVDRDGSGSIYLTSYVSGPLSEVGTFVKKVRRDGTPIWSTRISNFWVDNATALTLSPTDELFVTGGTFLALGDRSFGQEDAFLVKLDKQSGSIIWATQAGSADSDYSTAVSYGPYGDIYIAGVTLGNITGTTPHQGGLDVFAMKFSPDGNLVSSWQKGTFEDDSVTSMAVDACDRVFVAGYSRGPIVEGAEALGGDDMVILRAAL